jgi:hypothetical protein
MALALAALAPAILSGPASAQTGFTDMPNFNVDTGGGGAAGSDDSTIGSMSAGAAAQLTLSPSLAAWTDVTQWKVFTVTNSGGQNTTAIAPSIPGGGYTLQNSCSALAPGGSCAIQVKPNGQGVAAGILQVTASVGGTAQANLSVVPPASLSVSPATLSWTGTFEWKQVTVSNSGGQPSGTVSAALTAGGSSFEANSACTTVAPGQSCQLQIRPVSTITGSQTGTLAVTANPGGGGNVSLTAAGTTTCTPHWWGLCQPWTDPQRKLIGQILTGDECAARCAAGGYPCCYYHTRSVTLGNGLYGPPTSMGTRESDCMATHSTGLYTFPKDLASAGAAGPDYYLAYMCN